SITQKQLADRLGLSYAGIRYVMKKLQERGLLKRIGSTKKGQWIIKQ
ncbi:MAG TPA: winged helix-turn-helix transcriptional regulator, partial [Candidatus Ventrisoma faecale]|nr:winged helix-turn-helix transcriptional regulator [Candidatus Ventrisoma faecale]